MVRVTLCLRFVLLVLILKRSDAVIDYCNEFVGETTRSSTELIEQLLKNQERVGHCLEHQGKYFHNFQPSSMTLKDLEAVNNILSTTIDVITKTAESLYQKSQELEKKQRQLQTTNEGIKMTVEPLNQTVRGLCGEPEDVCRELFEALKFGDVNSTKNIFKCTNDSCTANYSFFKTPLIHAAGEGSVELVRVLLDEGAYVDRTDPFMNTALHYAATYGYLEVCRLLLDWGAKVDPLDSRKETPLQNAAREGHLSVVKLLVERGADVRLRNYDGQTASDVARVKGKKDVTEWLESEQLTQQLHTFNATCSKHNKSEAVNTDLQTQLQSIEEVLNRNIEEQKQLQSAISRLTKAVGIQNQTVQVQCEHPEKVCWELFKAIHYGYVNTVKILVKCIDDCCEADDCFFNTPLTYAARQGIVEVVLALLEAGVNVEETDINRSTAVHAAAWHGHLSVCRLLLDWGAKVNHVDKWKNTPLHDAAREGHLSEVKLLVERGADVKLQNDIGQTASDLAQCVGKKDVAEWLDLVSRG